MTSQGWSDKRKREGGEMSVIDDDKGEVVKSTTTGMVAIRRDAVAVASVRGTKV